MVKRTKKLKAKKTSSTRPLVLNSIEVEVASDCCEKSSLILSHTHESSQALLKAYGFAREQRGGRRGMTTDQEQDLLRAMLVMAAAGLDAMSKQLVRDALPALLKRNDKALNTFEKFIARRLGTESIAIEERSPNKFLARILSRPSPQAQLIEEYISDLTRGSLQSTDALFQIAAALGIDPISAGIEPNTLTPIFNTRNSIIHELDINLDARRRNRHVRRQTTMIKDTNVLINVSVNVLNSVDTIVSSEAS